MNYTKEDLEYLSGELFSNGYSMQLHNNLLWNREHSIVEICAGYNVIHVGCCDHIPLIEKKINEHRWLHRLLDERCNRVVGVDINQEAVDYVNNNNFAKEKVYCVDISTEDALLELPQIRYDYIVLGEIVEHLDNPVEFLRKLKSNTENNTCFTNVKFTVPNAYVLQKQAGRRGIECINTDHRYWFTPYTIGKVLIRSGITPQEYFFASCGLGGNGATRLSDIGFKLLEKAIGKPTKYKSYRGDSIIVMGE